MGNVIIYQKNPDGSKQELKTIDSEGATWTDAAKLPRDRGLPDYFWFNWGHTDSIRKKNGEEINVFRMAYWGSESSRQANENKAEHAFNIVAGQRRSISYEVDQRQYTIIVEHQLAGKERR